MRYNIKGEKDYHGGKVCASSSPTSSSSLWWVVPAAAGQMVEQSTLLLLKSRTIQAFLGMTMFILVMTLFVILGDRASAVQLDLSLPPWSQMKNNLQSMSEFGDDRMHPKREEPKTQPMKQILTGLTAEDERYPSTQKPANKLNVEVYDRVFKDVEFADQHRTDRNSKYSLPHLEDLEAESVQLQHPSSNTLGTSEVIADAKLAQGVDILNQQSSSLAPSVLDDAHDHHAGPEGVRFQDAAADLGTKWIQFPYPAVNETEHLMLQIRQNGTFPCHNIRTKTAQVLGLGFPQPNELEQYESNPIIRLSAGPVHEFLIVSIGDDGRPRCSGGDYYETDLSGPKWKSRPPVLDCNNGTYSVRLQMDPRFASGVYTFKIILLFTNFHSLRHHPRMWARMEEVATYQIEFVASKPLLISALAGSGPGLSSEPHIAKVPSNPESSESKAPLLELPMCKLEDFTKKYWSGRWTRENATEDCEYDRYGRWKCVDPNLKCQKPWCKGRVGSLESNGWVYSAHCAFKIFDKKEAWQCLDGKWLFFWGDSNHIDTIRNLLNFVLGFEHRFKFLDRRMDITYFSPPNNRSSVRITSMFNGHSNVTKNYEGLFSLHDPQFAAQLRSFFTGETAPNFMIMNSGLHDGVYWKDVERFMKDGVEFAADFWADVWNKMKARRPDLLYRTTVSTGGNARNMSFNPHKLELFNHLMVDRFVRMELERFHIIDGFDYTYPWHYDHKTNDGVHYGRPPSKSKWAGGNIGHQYFVDLMLVHILLNAICPPS